MPRMITCKKCGRQLFHPVNALCRRCRGKGDTFPPVTCPKCNMPRLLYGPGVCHPCWRIGGYIKAPVRICKLCGAKRPQRGRTSCYACNRKTIQALGGVIPKRKQIGDMHPNWAGGRIVACSVPGCHRLAGWRYPYEIKRSTTGFRCSEHRRVMLPQIMEESHESEEPEGSEELQSCVA